MCVCVCACVCVCVHAYMLSLVRVEGEQKERCISVHYKICSDSGEVLVCSRSDSTSPCYALHTWSLS